MTSKFSVGEAVRLASNSHLTGTVVEIRKSDLGYDLFVVRGALSGEFLGSLLVLDV